MIRFEKGPSCSGISRPPIQTAKQSGESGMNTMEEDVPQSNPQNPSSAGRRGTVSFDDRVKLSCLPMIAVDRDGKIEMWNPAAERLLGWSEAEVLGRLPPCMTVDRQPDFFSYLERAFRGESVSGYETSGQKKDGSPIEVSVAIAPISGEDGQITHLMTVLIDITERKRREHLIARQLTLLEMIATGRPLSDVLTALAMLMEHQVPGVSCSFVLPDESGMFHAASAPSTGCSQPILSQQGEVLGAVVLSTLEQAPTPDQRQLLERAAHLASIVIERERAEEALRQRERIIALNTDISLTLTRRLSLPLTLRHCAEALVRHLHVAFARIWLLNEEDHVLELAASAGIYTNLHGSHSRIPINSPLKISRIARGRRPRMTNRVLQETWATDIEWAKREGMVAFAGYPLI
ncbi:MAG: hypothetical protein C4294_08090, partial [Nitrospiraceae bacterium]